MPARVLWTASRVRSTPSLLGQAELQRDAADEGHRRVGHRLAEGAEHRPVVDRLRGRDRGVGVAHRRGGDGAHLDDQVGLDAEEGRRPQHQVGELADLDRADPLVDAVGDRRVDGDLGDVALDAEVVVVAGLLRQAAALDAHLVGGLEGADDDLADAAHGLAVGGDHREGADVVEDVLRRDGLLADAALGEGDVLRDRRVEVVADHEHVEMLVDGVDRVGPRRVGRGRQHVRLAAHLDDVRRVAAAGALGVVGVDGAVLERGDGVLDEAQLVQRVGVDHHLDVVFVGDGEAVVDRRRRGAPVLVQLERRGAAGHLLLQRRRQRGVALAGEGEVHGEAFRRLDHAADVPGAGRAGGGVGAGRRAGAAAEHGGDAGIERLVDLLRRDEVDVHVEGAGGEDLALAGDRLGAGADDDVDVRLDVRVAGLADAGDLAVLDADVGLDDAPVVDDQRVGDDGVDGAVGAGHLALAHAVADHLAAAELHLLAVGGEVLLDLDDEIGIGEADLVAGGRPEHLGVGGAGNAVGHLASSSAQFRSIVK